MRPSSCGRRPWVEGTGGGLANPPEGTVGNHGAPVDGAHDDAVGVLVQATAIEAVGDTRTIDLFPLRCFGRQIFLANLIAERIHQDLRKDAITLVDFHDLATGGRKAGERADPRCEWGGDGGFGNGRCGLVGLEHPSFPLPLKNIRSSPGPREKTKSVLNQNTIFL